MSITFGQKSGRISSRSTRHAKEEHVVFDGPGLHSFVELLSSLGPKTTIDLNGRTLAGNLPESLDNELLIDRDGIAIRNGRLELPPGSCISFRPPSEHSKENDKSRRSSYTSSCSSSGYCSYGGWPVRTKVRLENVTITGTGGKPSGEMDR